MIDNDGIACAEARLCAVCGGTGRVRHKGLRDQLFGAPGSWSIRQCDDRRCGLGWIDPKPLTSEIGKLYESYYTHASIADERGAASAYDARSHPGIKKLLAALFPRRSAQFRPALLYLGDMKPGRLLEVGCGSGQFLESASSRGWAAEGIDFDEKAIAAANARSGVSARVADIDDASLVDGSYDAIVMNHVIEHVAEPARVLQRCYGLLRKGGRVVMITPNMASQGYKLFGQDWRGLEIPRHLHIFTPASLRRLARAAGFPRVQVFSPLGGHETPFLVEQSRLIAQRAGRVPPAVDGKKLRRRAIIRSIVGQARGEFVVVVAQR